MCGIFGYVGKGFHLNSCLKESGNSSTVVTTHGGVAMGSEDTLFTDKTEGRMPAAYPADFPESRYLCGIAHTRWATHGAPTETNAHPHCNTSQSIAIVHNGIIENYKALKKKLEGLGHTFRSETDSEIIVHLIDRFMEDGLELHLAFLEALKSIEGTYGIALVARELPSSILIGRKGSPLIIGQGDGVFIGRGAKLAQSVDCDTDQGQVVIGAGAVIKPFTCLTGPVYIAEKQRCAAI